mgnify:CR=1 FL=1
MSDNSPFGAAEFKRFAERWEFKHTTSSPRFAQSNGRVEAAVKLCKGLMQKAIQSGTDAFLGLLDYRNTPREDLGVSPAQLMFGRRTRTRLPIADALMTSAGAKPAQAALTKAKLRQAAYYNRGARERPPLEIGQTVRVKYDDTGDWRKAGVVQKLPHRSYSVQLESGTKLRRTSRHIRFSPIVIPDTGDESPSTAPPPDGPPA